MCYCFRFAKPLVLDLMDVDGTSLLEDRLNAVQSDLFLNVCNKNIMHDFWCVHKRVCFSTAHTHRHNRHTDTHRHTQTQTHTHVHTQPHASLSPLLPSAMCSYGPLIRASDGDEYNLKRFNQDRIDKYFQVFVVTQEPFPDDALVERFFPIEVLPAGQAL